MQRILWLLEATSGDWKNTGTALETSKTSGTLDWLPLRIRPELGVREYCSFRVLSYGLDAEQVPPRRKPEMTDAVRRGGRRHLKPPGPK